MAKLSFGTKALCDHALNVFDSGMADMDFRLTNAPDLSGIFGSKAGTHVPQPVFVPGLTFGMK